MTRFVSTQTIYEVQLSTSRFTSIFKEMVKHEKEVGLAVKAKIILGTTSKCV